VVFLLEVRNREHADEVAAALERAGFVRSVSGAGQEFVPRAWALI
jgi:hypothetical protein